MRRVVVTGLGAVSPFGAGVKAYWAGLAAGACAIRPLTLIEVTDLSTMGSQSLRDRALPDVQ